MFLNECVYAGNKLHTPRPELAGRFGTETLVSNNLWAQKPHRSRKTCEAEGYQAPKTGKARRFRETSELGQKQGGDGNTVEHSVTAEEGGKAEHNTRAGNRNVPSDRPWLSSETAVSQQPKPQEGEKGAGAFLVRRRQEQAGWRKDV